MKRIYTEVLNERTGGKIARVMKNGAWTTHYYSDEDLQHSIPQQTTRRTNRLQLDADGIAQARAHAEQIRNDLS